MKYRDLEPVFYDRNGNRRRATGFAGALALLVVLPVGCTVGVSHQFDGSKAEKFVENKGYTNVDPRDTDHFPFTLRRCDEDDQIQHTLTATDPSGHQVELDVCKGLFNGATIHKRLG